MLCRAGYRNEELSGHLSLKVYSPFSGWEQPLLYQWEERLEKVKFQLRKKVEQWTVFEESYSPIEILKAVSKLCPRVIRVNHFDRPSILQRLRVSGG